MSILTLHQWDGTLFSDVMRKNVLIMRSTEPFYFSDSDVPDTKRLISKIEESLGKCGMSFVSSGLGAFEKNENIDSGKR